MDIYVTEKLTRVNVPEVFRPHINVNYPKNNFTIFEEWLYKNFVDSNSDRLYLPVFWTSFFVNNNYGQDDLSVHRLQQFIDSLDRSKGYWTVVQYDDTCIIDFKDLDIIVFGMARRLEEQRVDYFIPLMGEPNPYTFNPERRLFANFVGNITHDIRKKMLFAVDKLLGYYVRTNPHDAESYCMKMAQSVFTLCPRGYSATSFRITEALEYGSIPVFISDVFIVPHNLNFEDYGVLIHENNVFRIDEILKALTPEEIYKKQQKGHEIYQKYYTYASNKNLIIKYLEHVD